MSSTQVTVVQGSAMENRRLHPRRRIQQVAYVHFDQDNGGILLDLSEGGMNFQGVAGVMEGEPCRLKFMLPETNHCIEVGGQVVWSNSSRKGGGMRFVDLPDAMRQLIREWLSGAVPSADVAADVPKKVAVQFHAAEEQSKLDTIGNELPIDVPAKNNGGVAGGPAATNEPIPAAAKRSSESVAPLGQNCRPIFLPAESLSKSDPQRLAGIDKLAETRVRVSKTGVITLAACLIALVAILATYHSSRFADIVKSIAMAGIGSPESVPSDLPAHLPVNATVQNFSVEVVDSRNRRWILTNASEAPPHAAISAIGPAAAKTALLSPPAAPQPPVTPRPRSNPVKPAAVSPPLSLQLPHLRNARPVVAELEAPAVGGNTFPAALGDSRALVVPPGLPEPSPPQLGTLPREASFPQPVLVQSVQPAYPPAARAARVDGAVRISATIDKNGVPTLLKVLSGDPRLSAAALGAVRLWRYRPAWLNGNPVESETVITINFQLN